VGKKDGERDRERGRGRGGERERERERERETEERIKGADTLSEAATSRLGTCQSL